MYRFRPGRAVLAAAALTVCRAALAEPADEAAPAATPPARAELSERSREQELILQSRLPASEQQELQGDDERFLALWLPALSESAEGTVILLPGYGEHADHPAMAGPLRQRLPAAGWNSLSISLPDEPSSLARRPSEPDGAAPDPSEPTPEAAPGEGEGEKQARVPVEQAQMPDPAASTDTPPVAAEEVPDENAHAERIFARIDAAIAFAQTQQSRQIVLVGQGTGGHWAARYAAERKPAALHRLALISPRSPSARSQAQTPGGLPQIAVGDFFYRERLGEQSAARQRLLASQRSRHGQYHQVALQALPGDREAEREQLFRRLRGWLSPQPD